ncbi:hypothetical protein T4B_7852 [Trichinella pseudospiralis]|uniref:Uncharacterized protein n=1 Tax=Trichinella pseudospiralis TaxID=6337 RepID=A0A0V1F296_TRIPS|nr:hypothetical protein T4A_6435 [Trichinella pseudospiralis]KRZ34336.1 hypothetical protein T4B_7852 [Trichinella pseudospiralis]KRZ45658.1 hypothetical protein T4C_5162 [Trichinella pseudospiralis]
MLSNGCESCNEICRISGTHHFENFHEKVTEQGHVGRAGVQLGADKPSYWQSVVVGEHVHHAVNDHAPAFKLKSHIATFEHLLVQGAVQRNNFVQNDEYGRQWFLVDFEKVLCQDQAAYPVEDAGGDSDMLHLAEDVLQAQEQVVLAARSDHSTRPNRSGGHFPSGMDCSRHSKRRRRRSKRLPFAKFHHSNMNLFGKRNRIVNPSNPDRRAIPAMGHARCCTCCTVRRCRRQLAFSASSLNEPTPVSCSRSRKTCGTWILSRLPYPSCCEIFSNNS